MSEDNTCRVRVANIYSALWRYEGPPGEDLSKKLQLGGLEPYYELYKDQLPRLLPKDLLGGDVAPGDVQLAEPVSGVEVTDVDAMLFALPSNQVVLAVILGFNTRPLLDIKSAEPVIDVLDLGLKAEINIRGKKIEHFLNELQGRGLVREGLTEERRRKTSALLPERHQLVFVKRRDDEEQAPGPAVINEIIYREDPPFREEFTRARRPQELTVVAFPDGQPSEPQNGSPGQPSPVGELRKLGVVTSYVSLLYGHRRFVEHSIFLSTVHAVGTASRFRQIWHEAYLKVSDFRNKKQRAQVGEQKRADLEELADHLGNLEFDLTFSVEFPLMRIESFQTALYEAMDLSNQAKALSQMFDQLDGSLRSEITAIDVRERNVAERRQKWNAFAASVLSLIGVSVGFVIAFLGVNTTEVPGGGGALSMWNPHFANLYLIAGLFALTPVFFICFPYLRQWVEETEKSRKNDAVVEDKSDGAAVPEAAKTGERMEEVAEAEEAEEERSRKQAEKARRRWRLLPLWCGLVALLVGATTFAVTVGEDHVGKNKTIIIDAIVRSVAIFVLLVGLTLVGLWLRPYLVKRKTAAEKS